MPSSCTLKAYCSAGQGCRRKSATLDDDQKIDPNPGAPGLCRPFPMFRPTKGDSRCRSHSCGFDVLQNPDRIRCVVERVPGVGLLRRPTPVCAAQSLRDRRTCARGDSLIGGRSKLQTHPTAARLKRQSASAAWEGHLGSQRFRSKIVGAVFDFLRWLEILASQRVRDFAPIIDVRQRKIVTDEVEWKDLIPRSRQLDRCRQGLEAVLLQRDFASPVVSVIDRNGSIADLFAVDDNIGPRGIRSNGQTAMNTAAANEGHGHEEQ